MMVGRKIKHKGLVAFLLFLVIVIGLLAYQNARDFSQLKSAFDTEKAELEKDLDKVITNYQNIIAENHDYSDKLEVHLTRVVALRDSIRDLEAKNYRLLRVYKKKIGVLEEQNAKLMSKIDSLNAINQELYTENDSVREVLNETEELNTKLSRNNKILERKVASAEQLEIANIDFNAMKPRGSSRLTTTYRSWKATAFKVSFDLLENKVIDKGHKPIHVQLLGPDKKVITPKGKIRLKNGKLLSYSDIISAEYYNEQVRVMSLVKIEKGSIQEGAYTARIFANKIFITESTIKLK